MGKETLTLNLTLRKALYHDLKKAVLTCHFNLKSNFHVLVFCLQYFKRTLWTELGIGLKKKKNRTLQDSSD